MSDNAAAARLNDPTLRNVPRDIIQTWEILDATAPADFAGLTADQKQTYLTIISAGTISIASQNIRTALAAMFGAGSATRANLIVLQTRKGSRAEEIGLERVRTGHVTAARG